VINGDGYYFPSKSLALTNYLTSKGFKIDKVRDSFDDPKYKTFFFVRTPELNEAIISYLKSEGKYNDEQ